MESSIHLSYLKVASLQVTHGAAFGMTQPNANKWLHLLLVVMHQTLRDLGDAPARHLLALRERLCRPRRPANRNSFGGPAALQTFSMRLQTVCRRSIHPDRLY